MGECLGRIAKTVEKGVMRGGDALPSVIWAMTVLNDETLPMCLPILILACFRLSLIITFFAKLKCVVIQLYCVRLMPLIYRLICVAKFRRVIDELLL